MDFLFKGNNDRAKSTIIELNPDIKQCPKCKTLIQKDGGCSEMKCIICKIRFNFDTEKRIYRPMVPDTQNRRIALMLLLATGCFIAGSLFIWSINPESKLYSMLGSWQVFFAISMVILFLVLGVMMSRLLTYMLRND